MPVTNATVDRFLEGQKTGVQSQPRPLQTALYRVSDVDGYLYAPLGRCKNSSAGDTTGIVTVSSGAEEKSLASSRSALRVAFSARSLW